VAIDRDTRRSVLEPADLVIERDVRAIPSEADAVRDCC
jgi:hypothetical protein